MLRKIKKTKNAVVLLSGGLDSAVSLWWAHQKGFRCHALSFNYGQRHTKELKQASKLAKKLGVPWSRVDFQLPWGGSSLTDRAQHLPKNKIEKIGKDGIPSTYVPARNTIFLSFGMSWADKLNAQHIVIGANAIDYSGYPDCRPGYINAFETVANKGSRLGTQYKKRIKIEAPLLKLTKAGIIKLGMKLGVPLHLTWSCYSGNRLPCGRCDSCVLRDKGFLDAGVSV